MDLAEMPTWYDQLPPEKKSELDSIREGVSASTRIIPEDHGEELQRHLRVAERKFLSTPEPFCFIRISDVALGFLNGGYPITQKTHSLEWKLPMSGLSRSAYHLRSEMIEAVREAPLVGVHQNWEEVAYETAVTLAMLGIELPCDRAVETWSMYHLLIRGLLFSFLAGRKVVLVGHLAGRLAEAMKNPEFIRSYSRFGPIKHLKIVDFIETSPREKCRWEEVGLATEKLKSIDFDVALISYGGLAKILAHRVWKMGKTALDVGYIFDALLAVDPYQRSQRPILKDATWPESSSWGASRGGADAV